MTFGIKKPLEYTHKSIPVIHEASYDFCPGCGKDMIGPPSKGLAPAKFPQESNELYAQTIHLVCQSCYTAQSRLNRGTFDEFKKARQSNGRGAKPVVGVSQLLEFRETIVAPIPPVSRAKSDDARIMALQKASAGLMNMAQSFMAHARHMQALVDELAAAPRGTSGLCALEELVMAQPPRSQQALLESSGLVGGSHPLGLPEAKDPSDGGPSAGDSQPLGAPDDPSDDDIDFGMTDEQRTRMDAAVKNAAERASKVAVEVRREEI